ncbi:MAG: helix-turn-helix transcriptional regulator [Lachnospiraceae bacterium]|nr:helix-turn-helix transcriptional regulator [Lachnospiraceae bacterium]
MRVRKDLNVCMGERIRQARNSAGYTQEKLAEMIDVTIQYISDLERGVVGTSIPTLVKICEALSVSSDFLLMGLDENVKPLDISLRLQSLSPAERKIAESAVDLVLEALQMNPSNSSTNNK